MVGDRTDEPNKQVPSEVLQMISAVGLTQKMYSADEENALKEFIINRLKHFGVYSDIPIILRNTYNKNTFIFDDDGVDYLVFDSSLIGALQSSILLYLGEDKEVLSRMIIPFYMAEQAYADGDESKAAEYTQLSLNHWIDVKKTYMVRDARGPLWFTYAYDFCLLHELGHYYYKREETDRSVKSCIKLITSVVDSLSTFDTVCERMRDTEDLERVKEGLKSLLKRDTTIGKLLIESGLTDKRIDEYFEYGDKKGFPNGVTRDEYVEECFCDFFAINKIIKNDNVFFKDTLKGCCLIVESAYLIRTIKEDIGEETRLFYYGVDRINILSMVLRKLYGNQLQATIQEFFDEDSNKAFFYFFTTAIAFAREEEVYIPDESYKEGLIDIMKTIEINRMLIEKLFDPDDFYNLLFFYSRNK